jgi:hypothetical protein
MSIFLLTKNGIVVETSEKRAPALIESLGWSYLEAPESTVETVSAPVIPKRRGRPPKNKDTNG